MEDSPYYTQISFYSVKTHTPLWMLWEDFCPQAKCVDVEIVNYQKILGCLEFHDTNPSHTVFLSPQGAICKKST